MCIASDVWYGHCVACDAYMPGQAECFLEAHCFCRELDMILSVVKRDFTHEPGLPSRTVRFVTITVIGFCNKNNSMTVILVSPLPFVLDLLGRIFISRDTGVMKRFILTCWKSMSCVKLRPILPSWHTTSPITSLNSSVCRTFFLPSPFTSNLAYCWPKPRRKSLAA